MQRRHLLGTGFALAAPSWPACADDTVRTLLQRGGVVIAFRHALAPGTFDPEGFRLDDCSTQRNLNDEGRAQARRIGQWFRERNLTPTQVRTSPWCRCVDTAALAFGRAERWAALASPRGTAEAGQAQRLAELRRALAAVPAGRFEAWVTHQFVLQDLTGLPTQSAEALVLRTAATDTAATSSATAASAPGHGVQVLARASLY